MIDPRKLHRRAVRELVAQSQPLDGSGSASAGIGGAAILGRASKGSSEGKEEKEKEQSPAMKLVEIARAMYNLGVSQEGDAFAISKTAPHILYMVRGDQKSLRSVLARTYYFRHETIASSAALSDATTTIDALAQMEKQQDVHLRVAKHGESLWLDLGDATGRAIRIDGYGWEVSPVPPVLFRRTKLTGAMQEPRRREPGGACDESALDDLWTLLNVAPADRPLLAAWLVSCFIPDIAHPVLVLQGEQGTGKSTAARMIVRCVDDGPVPLRKAPRDVETWVTAAAGSWVVALDNLSDMPAWLSDSLCRAVTGDGDIRRKLFTDGDLHTICFRRCVVLNGIDLGALRGDLADRMLPINLIKISESQRIADSQLWPRFEAAHPMIMGGILDLAVAVQEALPRVVLQGMPRMADFARVLACVDGLWGTDGLAQFQTRQVALAEDSLAADPFIAAIADRFPRGWEGTAGDLFTALNRSDAPRGWPTSARTATTILRRQAPVLRKAGWLIDDDGAANHAKVLRWTIVPPARPLESPE